MSRTHNRRPLQRLGLVGVGSAILFVGIAPSANAATDVVIPLEPAEVVLAAIPVENGDSMDPMADPADVATATPFEVQYGGTLTIEVPDEFDASAADVTLGFDDDADPNTPDVEYSSALLATDPLYLDATGQSTGTIVIQLPADPGFATDEASLFIEPLDPAAALGPAFVSTGALFYALEFTPTAGAAETVEPLTAALSQLPCTLTSGTRCPFPTPVTAGSTVTLDLTAGSVLRELGLASLTGVQVGLQELDADGIPTGAAVLLPAQVTGSTATFVLPKETAAGQWGLVVAQQTPTLGVSGLLVEITVEAAATAAAPTTAAPTTAAPVNAGLRSNTGVEAVETGSTGTVAVAAGAGMLLLAGAGGVAVARNRRRAAAEGGTCGA